ncbi:MAG: energy transducer TonB [Burkholderiales bacterium]|nr:energy transducer TonB [Burkholderiales bacterium]
MAPHVFRSPTMIASPSLPKFLAAERLLLALIVSAAIHSLMLLGIKYHSSIGSGPHVALELVGVAPLQVRIDLLPAPPPDDAVRVTQSDSPAAAPSPTASPPPQDAAVKPAPRGSVPPPDLYFRAGDLDVRPQIRDRVIPVYPESAVNLTGRVIVNIFISASGTVDEVAVVRAEPPGIFDESAISAFSAARFTPGMKGNNAVKSLLVLEVNYETAEGLNAQTGAR